MKRLALLALILMAGCFPAFREVSNCEGELCLSLEGESLILASPGFQYGAVIVYAETVQSPYCVAPCNASEGALLRFKARDTLYPRVLPLGSVQGLKKADASVVYPGAREAVDMTLETE